MQSKNGMTSYIMMAWDVALVSVLWSVN